MIVIPWSLAAVLAFESAATPAGGTCEPADNRCKAEMFTRRAAAATTARQRALYLHAAHRTYLALFDQTGDLRHLCAARRTFDQSLAIKDQPDSQRASFEAVRDDLTSRERKHGASCKSAAKRPKPEPPMVAARSPAPLPEPTTTPAERSAPPAATAPEPVAELLPIDRAASPEPLHDDPLMPVTAQVRRASPPVLAPSPATEDARRDRRLVIAGGVTLGVGLALAGVAGFAGDRSLRAYRAGVALHDEVPSPPDDVARTKDAALEREYRTMGSVTLGTAIAGGVGVIVGAVLAGVGGRRLARAASNTAFMPVPGGLAFHARF